MNKLILLSSILILLSGCTENQRARAFGGSAVIELEKGQKLVNVTWKNADLWYLTRPMHLNESAETYDFIEKSSFGLVEGHVKFVEKK